MDSRDWQFCAARVPSFAYSATVGHIISAIRKLSSVDRNDSDSNSSDSNNHNLKCSHDNHTTHTTAVVAGEGGG